MPEETQVAESETENEQPTGEMPEQDAAEKQPEAVDAGKIQAELEKVRTALSKANAEAADRRKKLEAYEKAEQERKEAELSEKEKLEKRLAEAEQARQQAEGRARDTLIRSAFVSEAARAGAANPSDAYALAIADGAEVEVDGNTVSGVGEAVKALVDAGRLPLHKPKAPNLNGGAGGGQRTSETAETKLNEAELAMAQKLRLTPEQYMKSKSK